MLSYSRIREAHGGTVFTRPDDGLALRIIVRANVRSAIAIDDAHTAASEQDSSANVVFKGSLTAQNLCMIARMENYHV